MSKKVLDRIQNSCYNGYARTPPWVQRNSAKILEHNRRTRTQLSKAGAKVGTHRHIRRFVPSANRSVRLWKHRSPATGIRPQTGSGGKIGRHPLSTGRQSVPRWHLTQKRPSARRRSFFSIRRSCGSGQRESHSAPFCQISISTCNRPGLPRRILPQRVLFPDS